MLGLIGLALAAEPGSYGMDVAVGAGAGGVFGAWPDAGVAGTVGARVDLFPVPSSVAGPRVGASVWGRSNVWPLQAHTATDGAATTFRTLQYGLAAAIRYDPAAPVTGTFSFGFSRLDLEGYEGGVQTVPMFTIEAGLRQKLPRTVFLDWTAHGGWGSARGLEGAWEEWWQAGVGVALGVHLQ